MENNIKDNEEVKWKKSELINYRKKIFQTSILAFSLIGLLMTLLGLFFWYVPSWGGTFYLFGTDIVIHQLIIYILIMSIFISMAIFAIVYAIILFGQELRRLELKLSDLSQYQLVHVLTNKRWIQKDFRSLVYFEKKNLPIENITPSKDLVFINLNNIKKATISRIRSNYNITFHFKPIFGLNRSPTFNVKFKLNDYQELKNVLNQVIPLEILKE